MNSISQINQALFWEANNIADSENTSEKEQSRRQNFGKLNTRVRQLGVEKILNHENNFSLRTDLHPSAIADTVEAAMLAKASAVVKPFPFAEDSDVRNAINFLELMAWHVQISQTKGKQDNVQDNMTKSIQSFEYLLDHFKDKKIHRNIAKTAIKEVETLFDHMSNTEKATLVEKFNIAKKIVKNHYS